MASSTSRKSASADFLKWSFFGLMGLCFLLVLWTDERFWLNPADPHWKHVAPVKGLLALHGLAGMTALMAGACQMSSRIRGQRPALHRALGKVYIGAVCIASSLAIYIGTGPLEPATIHVQQIFQGGLWLLSALVAWACIRSGQMPLHKAWMMRSYGFTLIFVLSRVPDAFISSYSDQLLADMLWSLVIVALIAPEVILTSQTLWRVRSAKARHAKAAERAVAGEQFAG